MRYSSRATDQEKGFIAYKSFSIFLAHFLSCPLTLVETKPQEQETSITFIDIMCISGVLPLLPYLFLGV